MHTRGNTTIKMCRSKGMRGFTLVELLVVIAIIALLLSMMVPALNKARAQAKSAVCRSNQKQLGVATEIYAMENQDYMPLALDVHQGSTLNNNWMPLISRYLGDGKAKNGFWEQKAKVWNCPSFQRDPIYPAYMNYVYSYAMNVHLSFSYNPPNKLPAMTTWDTTYDKMGHLKKSQIKSPDQKILVSDGGGTLMAFDKSSTFYVVLDPRASRHNKSVNTLMGGLSVSKDTIDRKLLQFKGYPNLYPYGEFRP